MVFLTERKNKALSIICSLTEGGDQILQIDSDVRDSNWIGKELQQVELKGK